MDTFNGLLLDKDTKKQMEVYLSKVTGGLILLGDKGIGKSLCAIRIACAILNCTEKELITHPDFFRVESDNGTIRIEQMQVLKDKSSLIASKALKKVFLINDAESMSISAQNSILKILEDGNTTNILIFVSHSKLLSTIHSRSTVIKFKNPIEEDLRIFIEETGDDVSELILAMSDGKLGLYYQIKANDEFVKYINCIIKTINSMQSKRELLEVFHELKEKDKNNFYDSFEQVFITAFTRVLKDIFTNLLCYRFKQCPKYAFMDYDRLCKHYTVSQNTLLVTTLEQHLNRMQKKGAYNKIDFFDLIRTMVTD